ncbi:hypothetical protein GCK72_003326 [Caenorhabditis remanei]|uniref:Uncharacterized protein n=1 Tax=Caenorhabditis remanei TaxID=31234 RepID=A0A6A5HUP2_CAERE|nr:hypothetical protein GCK72_003326 [Caenorhabditis remanei]KAF1771499.1 hypothetical protein GCK72_003326 [Caenorhabditis remanei]
MVLISSYVIPIYAFLLTGTWIPPGEDPNSFVNKLANEACTMNDVTPMLSFSGSLPGLTILMGQFAMDHNALFLCERRKNETELEMMQSGDYLFEEMTATIFRSFGLDAAFFKELFR